MTSDARDERKRDEGVERRRYIPHLAEFYFKPTHDWSIAEAKKLYHSAKNNRDKMSPDTVHFKDCISGMKEMPEECVDLVIADPPFGIDFDGKSGAYNRDDSLVVSGYEEIDEDYVAFSESWIGEAARLLKDSGSMYIFSGWNNLEYVLRGARLAGLHLLNHLIWQYQFGVFTKRKFVSSHYHILLLVKNEDNYFFNKLENYPQDVWRLKRSYRAGKSKNSTKLPLKVVQKCIDYSSSPGQIVLDPFIGNGTTAVAARGALRHFIGYEINSQLGEIIASNLAAVEPGQFYIPYSDRLPSIEELAKKYPRAYREYVKRENQESGGE